MELEDFFPPRIIRELEENQIRVKLAQLDDKWGEFDAEKNEITINPYVHREAMVQRYRERLGVTVDIQSAYLLLLFHEWGHWMDRDNARKISAIEGENFADTLVRAREFRMESEVRAWEFALKKFLDWRVDFFDQKDFREWKSQRSS